MVFFFIDEKKKHFINNFHAKKTFFMAEKFYTSKRSNIGCPLLLIYIYSFLF